MRSSLIAGCAALAFVASSAHATSYTNLSAFQAAAPASSVAVDFESVTGGQLDTPLASLTLAGITFSPASGGGGNVFVASSGYNNFGAAIGLTTSQVLTANGNESFLVALATPVSALGFDVLNNGLGPVTVKFYDGATLLDTLSFSTGGYAFAGIVAPHVTGFTFLGTSGGALNTGLDNVRTAPLAAAVPEPASWALMISGFGLAGATMRRRQATGALA